MKDFEELQTWFASQCNGDWEHGFGIKIETLDNPGWMATINLEATELVERPFAEVKDNYEHDTEWLRCWRADQRFEIRCGPMRFADGLRIFLAWAAPSNPR